MKIKEIIKDLQSTMLDQRKLIEFTGKLAELGYKYKAEQFPALVNTDNFSCHPNGSPSNLAEALLWKIGKWKAYQKFTKNYHAENSNPTNTDVVFYAFAKHLKNPDIYPIYDQHAIRALWAIDITLSADEQKKCKSLLFSKNEKWKEAGSGKNAIDCYNIYVDHIHKIKEKDEQTTLKIVDQLLMPLGQALKRETKSYSEFISIRDQ